MNRFLFQQRVTPSTIGTCLRTFLSCKSMNSNDSSGRPNNRSSSLSGNHKPTSRQNTSGSISISSKSASDKSPGNSATNDNGIATVNRRLRSLLSHHLALPLFYAFNAIEEPNNKPLYRATKDTEIKDASGLDTIFERAVLEWHGDGNGKKVERDLTYLIREFIRAHAVCTGAEKKISCSEHEPYVRNASPSGRKPAKGSIDILLSDISEEEANTATPLALVEVGRINEDWWKKLDQAGKYLNIMTHENNLELKFNHCILCAVLTFEGDPTSQNFKSRFGVFLCWPKSKKPWQMALLWRASGVNLTQASKNFGMFLRVVYSFAAWRKENSDFDYHYLSSSVCRIDNKVSFGQLLNPRLCISRSNTLFCQHRYSNCIRSIGVLTVVSVRRFGLRIYILNVKILSVVLCVRLWEATPRIKLPQTALQKQKRVMRHFGVVKTGC